MSDHMPVKVSDESIKQAWETVQHLHPDALIHSSTNIHRRLIYLDPDLTEHLSDLQVAALATRGQIPYDTTVLRFGTSPQIVVVSIDRRLA